MKFLVNKLLLFCFFQFSISYAVDCIDSWYNSITTLKNENIMHIKGDIDISTDSGTNSHFIEFYLDRELDKIQIEFNSQILYFDKKKSLKLYKNTNQLYIDNPDTALCSMLFKIFVNGFNDNDFSKISEKEYLVKNKFNFDKIELSFDKLCETINSIDISQNNLKIKLRNIHIYSFNSISKKDLFNFGGNYFEYDLRN